jgi:hypothetical protein
MFLKVSYVESEAFTNEEKRTVTPTIYPSIITPFQAVSFRDFFATNPSRMDLFPKPLVDKI